MIRKLKRKFILLSMLSLFLLLVVIVTGMNLLNYTSVCREADEILTLISQNKGIFPSPGEGAGEGADQNRPLPPGMSPELPYESRYFSVMLDASGNVVFTETSRIFSVDTGTAIAYAQTVLAQDSAGGFLNDFRFYRRTEGDMTRVTFLDCGRRLDSFYSFLFTSIGMSLAGLFAVFLIITFFAGKIIQPIAESYEKQKRFITDAGHEIKTPLAIINTNIDLLEMEFGENESVTDIRQQAKRLSSLTNDLVSLARMEESEQMLPMVTFPVSEVMEEVAMPFQTLAQAQQKIFSCKVTPMLSMHGNEKSIGQLVSIFLDNALKYSPEGGNISLEFTKRNRSLLLSVSNTSSSEIDPADLPHVFDRFYRTDVSRNSETGGHGIGLSMAKAIVNAHGGRISAQTPDGHTFVVTATFPA